ncbi:hypothetical protein CLV28_0636 [Sediminihabitans luteus]|uniref:AEC family transporter n=1 Tax=Sediminihabitans luteus TaxID=1138585 RepID=A0A2M9CZU4_9CELL|nr:AEC family transporter [Sediminihabitans luteus]PJJ77417.1 hypothetical protein CLV28_0636 [Sediminihabitans luteus]GII98310.1 membrane protein [Sediminihabitans luteus]
MTAVLGALATIAVVVAAGWLVQVRRWLPDGAAELLATVAFTIASPCLLLATVAEADLGTLLSRSAAATWVTTLVLAAALALTARAMRLPAGRATVMTLSGSYVNAGNLGIPIAVYLFGSAIVVVPTMLVQLLVLAPLAFVILDRAPDALHRVTSAGAAGPRRSVLATAFTNPITVGTLVGLALAALPGSVPDVVLDPFHLVGAAAPPLALLTFGMALAPRRPAAPSAPTAAPTSADDGTTDDGTAGPPSAVVAPGVTSSDVGRRHGPWRTTRGPILVATAARAVVGPALALGVATLAGLDPVARSAVVTMAALPTAQNVVVYATRYRCAVDVASRACLVTTALAAPVLIVVAAVA